MRRFGDAIMQTVAGARHPGRSSSWTNAVVLSCKNGILLNFHRILALLGERCISRFPSWEGFVIRCGLRTTFARSLVAQW
jgi:hypothetical protein